MDTAPILADLRSQRERLDQAIAALEGLEKPASPKEGAAISSPSRRKPVAIAAPAKSGSRISPEGMARIIAATKARWARVRAAKASAAKGSITAVGRTLSPAARKRMSEAVTKRWAAARKQR
jgi:hypothetical protein